LSFARPEGREAKLIRLPSPSASILASENIPRPHPAGAGRGPCYERTAHNPSLVMRINPLVDGDGSRDNARDNKLIERQMDLPVAAKEAVDGLIR
jgi:hypothetical protein